MLEKSFRRLPGLSRISLLSFLVCILFIFMFGGCGKDKQSESKSNEKKVIKYQKGTPLLFPFANPECQNQDRKGIESLGLPMIHYWDGDQTVNDDYDLTNYNGVDSIKGLNIKETYHHVTFRWISNLKKRDKDLYVESTKEEEIPGQPLRICDENADYARETLETLSLTALANLDKAQKFYHLLAPSVPLRPITFYPMTIWEDIYEYDATEETHRQVETFTDNAAYGNEDNQASIYVFPQGQESRDKKYFNGLGLWEIPEVIIHEFGHHVFAHYFPISIKAGIFRIRGRFWNPPHLRPSPLKIKPRPSSAGGVSSLTKINRAGDNQKMRAEAFKKAIKALNEAFADLFAFYALGGKEATFKSISCFGRNRDVLSDRFHDYKRKILTATTLDIYFKDYTSDMVTNAVSEDCHSYSYDDEHIIGAVLAYGLNRLLEGNFPKMEERARLLLSWLKKLEKEYDGLTAQSGPGDFLGQSIQLLARTKMEVLNENKLNDEDCQVLKETFPFYAFNLCF